MTSAYLTGLQGLQCLLCMHSTLHTMGFAVENTALQRMQTVQCRNIHTAESYVITEHLRTH